MPKIVDRESRREEICGAALKILARGGPSALTLRSLAEELNGSITLVTHFFANRADLFEAIVDDLLSSRDYQPEADDGVEPVEALRRFMHWLIPAVPEEDEREASRIALVPMRESSPSIDHFFVAMEDRIRGRFRAQVERLVDDPAEVDALVDILRVAENGLVLSIVEHPDRWSLERRRAVIDAAVDLVAARAGASTAAG